MNLKDVLRRDGDTYILDQPNVNVGRFLGRVRRRLVGEEWVAEAFHLSLLCFLSNLLAGPLSLLTRLSIVVLVSI